ncbi:MAG: hypothetical protein ACE5I3_09705 [Phycisphaerae bacterium]
MFATTRFRRPWGLVATAASLAAAGCFLPGLPTSLTGLPAELQVVIDDPNSFAASPDDPLAALTPGTAVDDLSGLTGCWGWFEEAQYSLGGSPPTVFYEVYQFDADVGTANRWVFTPTFLLIPPLVAVDEGSFSVSDQGRIEIRLDHYTIIDVRTGSGREFTDLPDAVAIFEKLITLSGDQLLIGGPFLVDEETGEPIGRIFTRFDCPE